MFWPDVLDLKLFYASQLGKVARQAILRALRQFWPESHKECVLGIGFTHPYLEYCTEPQGKAFALMPAAQGALRWVPDGKNLSFLADEGDIPLPDASVQRVILVHALENSEQQRHMMSEIWRILAPGGKLIAVVPNRTGIWARVSASPFAHGSPFSVSQLRALFRDNQFSYSDCRHALFIPPSSRELVLRNWRLYEWLGNRFFTAFGGVLIMEGEKQVYAPSQPTAPVRVRKAYPAPAPQPVMTKHI